MILRCIGNDMQSAVVQFIKGSWMTGERKLLREKFSNQVKFVVSGEGFTWETQDKDRDIAAAQAGWAKAKSFILDPTIDFVLLDEIFVSHSKQDKNWGVLEVNLLEGHRKIDNLSEKRTKPTLDQ